MKFSITLITITLLSLFTTSLSAQEYDEGAPNLNPMSIPSSPAFSLLGVNPELVTRPSDVKEFKVDWRIKNYKLAPDLALEAQPAWWLYYKKKSPRELLEATRLHKILATTTVSMATAKIDNVNHLAYAVKFNLYKGYDPYSDSLLILDNEANLKEVLFPIANEIENLEIKRLESRNIDTLSMIDEQLIYLRETKKQIVRENMDEFAYTCNEKIAEKWNMDMVDMAFGRVYKYDNAGLDSLNFSKAGYGIWINASKGMGKHGLWTGIIKMNKVGDNRNYMLGTSYRFGTEKYNFFGELVRTKMNNNPLNGFAEDEQFAALRDEDLGMGWYKYADGNDSYTSWSLSYGGDFKLSKNVLLNFALRTELTGDLKFNRFLPIANIVCLMK